MFGNCNIDLYIVTASFSDSIVGVQNTRDNLSRKSPLEPCSYRLYSNHFEENQVMHPDKKCITNPKTDESST